MKIGVIGDGIIGSIVCQYLSKKGYVVDCISPEISLVSKKFLENMENELISLGGNFSPKLEKIELIAYRNKSDKIFKKKCHNFECLELATDMGLAKFWGANLAFKGLYKDLKNLNLTKKEWNFIREIIPFLDVQDFYKNNSSNKNSFCLNNKLEENENIHSSTIAVKEDLINNKKRFIGFDSSKAVFGNFQENKYNFTKINGKVSKIEIDSANSAEKLSVLIQGAKGVLKKDYSYIIVSCGAIGSYRLIKNSFFLNRSKKYFDKILHHPVLNTICFIPDSPYPKNYIGMSNFDLSCKVKNIKCFVNFIPLKSLIEIKLSIFKRKIKTKFFKRIFEKTFNFIKRVSYIFILPNILLHRLYISIIYLPSDFTASFIGNSSEQLSIKGGLRADFEKTILRNFWPSLLKKLKRRNIFNLFYRPLILKTGADFHYSSTLSNYTNDDGQLKDIIKSKKLIIVDSSSSKNLPIPNPTLYFIARAIKLVRNIR
tara:strand:- start:576 stop:2030 length:1455 start_codon:yes stop_codon:yes gene_type:complete